jgi:hypothetical protein
MNIYCCECEKYVAARLTSGTEIYPHRADLRQTPFWVCDHCGNHVGCHHKTSSPTRPLGVIANGKIKNARKHIHAILDPLWESGRFKRKQIYRLISDRIGYEYHTAEIRSLDEARNIYRAIVELAKQ